MSNYISQLYEDIIVHQCPNVNVGLTKLYFSTLYMLNFSEGTKTCTFCVIPPHWHGTCSWNPFSSKTRTYLFYIVNIMGADVLAIQGARASATMLFTMLDQINSVPPCQGLKFPQEAALLAALWLFMTTTWIHLNHCTETVYHKCINMVSKALKGEYVEDTFRPHAVHNSKKTKQRIINMNILELASCEIK